MGVTAVVVTTPENDESPLFTGLSHEADDGTRTHDTWLGKPVLYQLSYVRARPILTGLLASNFRG